MHIGLLNDPANFHTRKWARALENAGARVTVFSFDQGLPGDENWVRIPAPLAPGGKYSYLSYLKGGKRLAESIKAHRIDLVNALNVTPFGVWAIRSGFKPLVASALGADILEYPPPGTPLPHPAARSWSNPDATLSRRWKLALSRNYYRRRVAEVLAQAQLITGDNQHLLDCMRDWFQVPAPKLKLLRWGVEPELFDANPALVESLRRKYSVRPGEKVVLSPRGAKSVYQADIILDAFAQLLHGGVKDTHFLMLSAGYEVAGEVRRKAEALQAQFPHFHFEPGILPREEVYAMWNLVDVFISAPVYDGYSAALAEGRFAGAIPVVNDIAAHRELISHGTNGWMVTPFTAAQLAQDLMMILQDSEELKAKFAPANRKWIETHSLVKQNASLFLEWMEELLHRQEKKIH